MDETLWGMDDNRYGEARCFKTQMLFFTGANFSPSSVQLWCPAVHLKITVRQHNLISFHNDTLLSRVIQFGSTIAGKTLIQQV